MKWEYILSLNLMNDLKRKWEDLSFVEEQKYLSQAAYLVERQYVRDKSVEQVAKEIFLKENG